MLMMVRYLPSSYARSLNESSFLEGPLHLQFRTCETKTHAVYIIRRIRQKALNPDTAGSPQQLERGCRIIHAGFPFFSGLGLEAFNLPQKPNGSFCKLLVLFVGALMLRALLVWCPY